MRLGGLGMRLGGLGMRLGGLGMRGIDRVADIY